MINAVVKLLNYSKKKVEKKEKKSRLSVHTSYSIRVIVFELLKKNNSKRKRNRKENVMYDNFDENRYSFVSLMFQVLWRIEQSMGA